MGSWLVVLAVAGGVRAAQVSPCVRPLPIVRAEFSAAWPGSKEPLALQARFQVETLGREPWTWARLHPLPARLVNAEGHPVWTSQNMIVVLSRGYERELAWLKPARVAELREPAPGEEARAEVFRQLEPQLGALGLQDSPIELRGGVMSLPGVAPGQLDRLFDGGLLRTLPEGEWLSLAKAKGESFLAGLGPSGSVETLREALKRLPRLGRVVSDAEVPFEVKKQLYQSHVLATLLGAKPASLPYAEEDFTPATRLELETSVQKQARRVSEDLEVAHARRPEDSLVVFNRQASLLALRRAHGREPGLDFRELLQQDQARILEQIAVVLLRPSGRSSYAMEGVLFGFPLSDVGWFALHAGGSQIPRNGVHIMGGLGPRSIDWASEHPAKPDVVRKAILYEVVFALARAYLGHVRLGLPFL